MIWVSISVVDPHIPKSNRQKTLFKLREKQEFWSLEVDISNLKHVHYSTNNVNPSHWTTVRINLGPFRLGVDGLSPSPNLFKFKKKYLQ